MIRPLTAGTHQLHLRMQGSVSGQKTIRPPDCWDPPATSSQARKCLTVGIVGVKTSGSRVGGPELGSMVTGDGGHNVYPGSGLLYGGNTLLPA